MEKAPALMVTQEDKKIKEKNSTKTIQARSILL